MMNKILNKAGKRVKWFLPCYLLVFLPLLANAQSDRQLIRQGNKQFRAGNYAESEVLYRKAVEKNPRNSQAYFNLGNALLGQRKDSSAVSQFEASAKLETNPIRKAKAYHNMGVVCQGKKMFGEAIEAYKEALRNNPTDDETRYNLALCKRQQQQQQEGQAFHLTPTQYVFCSLQSILARSSAKLIWLQIFSIPTRSSKCAL